jgi:hypothetical protein
MPPAVGDRNVFARRAWAYSFSPLSAKRNRKSLLSDLGALNDHATAWEWAVNQKRVWNYSKLSRKEPPDA